MAEAEEAKTVSDTPYDEASISFPNDLSKYRYMAFNFYDSNTINNIEDVAVDLVVYANKSLDTAIGSNAGTTGLEVIGKGAGDAVDEFFGGSNSISPIFRKLEARAKEASTQNEAQLSDKTKKAFADGVNARNAIENGVFKFAVYLPIVNSFRETITHNWNAEKGIVAETIGGVVNPKVTKSIQGIANMFGARTSMVNPDWVQTYGGTGLRSFVLTWVLMPNTEQEAKDIFNIVRKFKRASSPELGLTGATVKPPLFCNIKFTNDTIENSVRMDEMVVSGIAINYSETGFMETFRDGVPKAISLELTVSERRMKTEKDWKPKINTEEDKYKDANNSLNAFLGDT